jgi:hypothetical protein
MRAEFEKSMEHFRHAAAHAAGGLGATVGPPVIMMRGSAMGGANSALGRATMARGFIGPAANRVSSAASQGWDTTISTFGPLAESARMAAERAAKLESKRRKNGNGNGSGNGNGMMSRMTFTAQAESKSGHMGLYALLATGAMVGAAGALIARRRTRAKWAEYEPSSISADASSFRGAGATSSKSMSGMKSSGQGMTDSDAEMESGAMAKAAAWTKGQTRTTVDTLRHKIHEATGDQGMGSKARSAMDKAGDKVNQGASHMAEKADARRNDTSSRSGSGSMQSGNTPTRGSERTNEDVDDMMRSAKNGRT